MPNFRKLAYKDRFVWDLVQQAGGESGSLPPLQFSPTAETQFLVSLDEGQFTRVFSALLAGADLVYPEQSHQVVWDLLKFIEYPTENPVVTMQTSFLLDARHIKRGINDAGNQPTIVNNVNAYGNFYVHQNPAAINDQMHYKLFLASGGYYIRHTWHRNTSCGILTAALLRLSDSTVIPITGLTGLDMRGSLVWNNITEGTFTIDEPGAHKLIFAIIGTSLAGQFQHFQSQTYVWKQDTII